MLDARKPINSFVKLLQHPEGPSASTLRRSAADELYELPKTETPYGKIVEQTTVLGTKGSLVWDHLIVFAFFHKMASESRQFFNLMRACADKAPGRCLIFSLYTDEVVPRNKLRPDMGGKYQAVYFQVLDFPEYIRSRLPLRWFTFGYVSVSEMTENDVNVSHLFRVVMRSWFGETWNLKETGFRLLNGGDVVHVYAKYVCSPQDERAYKFCFRFQA